MFPAICFTISFLCFPCTRRTMEDDARTISFGDNLSNTLRNLMAFVEPLMLLAQILIEEDERYSHHKIDYLKRANMKSNRFNKVKFYFQKVLMS